MITLTHQVSWLVSLMLWAAPPDRDYKTDESPDERSERYEQIAQSALEVAFDPDTTPLYQGKRARTRTAQALLAIAYHESGFALDVDKGPCRADRPGRCDGGRSACLMQIMVGSQPNARTYEGWTRADLFADREKCFRAGLSRIRSSASSCRSAPFAERLAVYAGGACSGLLAKQRSRELSALIERWGGHAPVPLDEPLD